MVSRRYHYLDPRVKDEFDTFNINDPRIPVLDCCHQMYRATIADEAKEIQFDDTNGCAADIGYVPSDDENCWGWYICDFEGAPGYKRLNFCPWCGKKITYNI